MKRITKLSELYKQIGNYLKQYGDADILSIATHSANEEHIRYSLNLTDIDREDFTHIGAISVCYEDKYFTEPKDCLSCKNSFSEEKTDGDQNANNRTRKHYSSGII